uniref:RING-type domain-containing protein n=1 Tax=Rhabditophanes sp. KR3021 TaxID=114890 RepID=A0AC35UEC7_9BILA
MENYLSSTGAGVKHCPAVHILSDGARTNVSKMGNNVTNGTPFSLQEDVERFAEQLVTSERMTLGNVVLISRLKETKFCESVWEPNNGLIKVVVDKMRNLINEKSTFGIDFNIRTKFAAIREDRIMVDVYGEVTGCQTTPRRIEINEIDDWSIPVMNIHAKYHADRDSLVEWLNVGRREMDISNCKDIWVYLIEVLKTDETSPDPTLIKSGGFYFVDVPDYQSLPLMNNVVLNMWGNMKESFLSELDLRNGQYTCPLAQVLKMLWEKKCTLSMWLELSKGHEYHELLKVVEMSSLVVMEPKSMIISLECHLESIEKVKRLKGERNPNYPHRMMLKGEAMAKAKCAMELQVECSKIEGVRDDLRRQNEELEQRLLQDKRKRELLIAEKMKLLELIERKTISNAQIEMQIKEKKVAEAEGIAELKELNAKTVSEVHRKEKIEVMVKEYRCLQDACHEERQSNEKILQENAAKATGLMKKLAVKIDSKVKSLNTERQKEINCLLELTNKSSDLIKGSSLDLDGDENYCEIVKSNELFGAAREETDAMNLEGTRIACESELVENLSNIHAAADVWDKMLENAKVEMSSSERFEVLKDRNLFNLQTIYETLTVSEVEINEVFQKVEEFKEAAKIITDEKMPKLGNNYL